MCSLFGRDGFPVSITFQCTTKPIAMARGLLRILLHLASWNFVESCSVMLLLWKFIEYMALIHHHQSTSPGLQNKKKQKQTHFIHSVFPTLRFPPVFPVLLSLSSFEGSDRRFWCFLFSNCHGRRSYLARSNRSLSYEKHPTEKHHRIH